MASIPVMNPPGKLTRPRLYKRKKRLYRGPKSTLKAHLRLANPKKKFKRKTNRRKRVKHAVAVRRKAAPARRTVRRARRKVSVSRRQSRRSKRSAAKLFNPFGSEMIVMGNPTRGGGRSSSHRRRKNNMARKRKSYRRRSRSLSNPFSASALLSKPKEMLTKDFATEAVSVAAGFMAPNIVLGYLPVQFRDSKIKYFASKTATIIGLSAAAGLVSKRASRLVLIGGGVSLLLDVWQEWQASRTPTAAAPAGTHAYYGDSGTGAYYGDGGMGDDEGVVY